MNEQTDMIHTRKIPRCTPLPEGISLRLYDKQGEVIFENSGKWLYPLFDAEDYIQAMDLDSETLFLRDKIAGRAAASLITRMGFRRCCIDTISRPAMDVFRKHGVDCSFNVLVEKIQCRTEEIITTGMDLDTVYQMIRKRAGRVQGVECEIRNLTAGYDAAAVLRGLTLTVRAGDQIVITGDNGAGKSTFLKCIIGTVPVGGGSIMIDGKPVSRVRRKPSIIGYVNQSVQASRFPVTAAELASLGLLGQKLSGADRKYQVEIAMRRTGCFHLAGRNVSTLSGGERQRVSLARCMAQNAGIILMDEPTSFLDRDSKEEFLDLLTNLVRSTMPTIILVSHDHEWTRRLGWPVKELKDGILC